MSLRDEDCVLEDKAVVAEVCGGGGGGPGRVVVGVGEEEGWVSKVR